MYNLNLYDWRIEGDVLGFDFQVIDSKENIIMRMFKESLIGDEYCVVIKNDKYEKICLLIALAVDLSKK